MGLERCLIMHKPRLLSNKTLVIHLNVMNLRDKLCVCNWSQGYVIRPNYEVLGFQAWSGITTPLVSIAFLFTFYLTPLLIYPPTCPWSMLLSPSFHPDVPNLFPTLSPHEILQPHGSYLNLYHNLWARKYVQWSLQGWNCQLFVVINYVTGNQQG